MKTECACHRGGCEGICREKNLNRKRVAVDKKGNTMLKRCPSAYDVTVDGKEIKNVS